MRRHYLFLIIASACGAVAAVALNRVGQEQTVAGTTPMSEIFVASRAIDRNEQVTVAMMSLESWPTDRVPRGATSDLKSVEGKFADQRLFPGEPLVLAKLADSIVDPPPAIATKSVPVKSIAADQCVVSMPTDNGLLQPGDRVDVIAYFSTSDEIHTGGVRPVLRNVEVFAIDGKTARSADGPVSDAESVSLLIDRDDQEAWILATELGRVRLTLTSTGDTPTNPADENVAASFLDWLATARMKPTPIVEAPPPTPLAVQPPTTEPNEPKPDSADAEAADREPVQVAQAAKPDTNTFRMLKLHSGGWTQYEIPIGDRLPIVTDGGDSTSTAAVPRPLNGLRPATVTIPIDGVSLPDSPDPTSALY